ncbi:MAG: hypothetical protein KA210_01315 [Bacteroidia bacterium]|jgi:hypothetical protein|nr:hypothetical protein [Bacteroidia bacterium]
MNEIIDFFNHPFFVIVGGISTVIAIVTFIYTIYIVLKGIIPVWIRLGKGLSNRKIAVYAESDFNNFKSMLLDSGIFKEKNIEQITNESLAKGETHTMMLVNYMDFKDKIEKILSYKKDSDSLIIYAPQSGERIELELMYRINENRNSIVVNMKGRLLNDILTSMITTIYEKR